MRRASQLAALGTPIRWEIAETLSLCGPSSVRELAERMGRKPASLYYHVQALLCVGLVVMDSTRRVSRRWEVVYRLVAPHLAIDRKRPSPAYKEALCRSCEAFLRLAAREHRVAVERGDLETEGDLHGLMVRRHTGRLGRGDLKKLNRLLAQVEGLFDKQRGGDQGGTYAVTCVINPLPTSPLTR